MKKLVIAAGTLALVTGLASCGGANGDNPGRAYMPDMYYSRAYETYGYNDVGGEYDTLRARHINYNGLPVPGTVARGDASSYHLSNDSAGLLAADALKNPLDSMAAKNKGGMAEAQRIYLVNCGICHGTALDGNGPLFNGGNGPYPAAPKNLVDANAKSWKDGHIFHVITFGKGQMGSYASQLKPEQRWWIIKYIRSKQGGAMAAAPTDSTAGAAMARPATGGSPAKARAEGKK